MKQIKKQTSLMQPSNWLIILIGAIIVIILAVVTTRFDHGRAAAPSATPTPLNAQTGLANPTNGTPADNFVEQVGSVTVRNITDVQGVYVFSEPHENAEKLGVIMPGDQGQLLGQDLQGEWLYFSIGDLVGWAPAYFFDVIAVR